MIRHLAHLCFYTDHLSQMVHFYRDGLGMQVKFTLDDDAGQVMGYYFACGDSTFIEIFDQALAVKQWGGQAKALASSGLYKHFCLEVTGLDELKPALEKQGMQVSKITLGMDNSRQAWIADPDGNAIELMEYTHQSMQLQRD